MGDLPGHPFRGNQYTAAGHAIAAAKGLVFHPLSERQTGANSAVKTGKGEFGPVIGKGYQPGEVTRLRDEAHAELEKRFPGGGEKFRASREHGELMKAFLSPSGYSSTARDVGERVHPDRTMHEERPIHFMTGPEAAKHLGVDIRTRAGAEAVSRAQYESRQAANKAYLEKTYGDRAGERSASVRGKK